MEGETSSPGPFLDAKGPDLQEHFEAVGDAEAGQNFEQMDSKFQPDDLGFGEKKIILSLLTNFRSNGNRSHDSI